MWYDIIESMFNFSMMHHPFTIIKGSLFHTKMELLPINIGPNSVT